MADEYRIEEIARDHPVGADVFVPFAITRLRGAGNETVALMRVRLQGISEAGERTRDLRITWSAGSVPNEPLAVQERTVTEWAACGVACAVIRLYAGMRVRQVAGEGDRFDYWVDDGYHEYGLEVSGTMTDDLVSRHRMKVRQLLDNSFGVDGYAVVVGFATREVILSFHRAAEVVR